MELTANAIQTVGANQNILFTDTPIEGNRCIVHRDGSGLVTLRGITNQCYARFKVSFSANIALLTTGDIGELSTAIAINGEPVDSSKMRVYPPNVNRYMNVASFIYIKVPKGCCNTISVENTSNSAINVQNANLIVERVA